jgi:hypothetical protein
MVCSVSFIYAFYILTLVPRYQNKNLSIFFAHRNPFSGAIAIFESKILTQIR